VGYSTKWGDSAADLAPLAGLYKDEVLGLAAALGVPAGIIGKPPSAGLWPGQTDEGEMGFTYGDIRAWSEGLPTAPAAAEAIEAMHAASMHKRRPVPHFDAGEWFGAHGKARSRQLS
jgi:NAD+ synthase